MSVSDFPGAVGCGCAAGFTGGMSEGGGMAAADDVEGIGLGASGGR